MMFHRHLITVNKTVYNMTQSVCTMRQNRQILVEPMVMTLQNSSSNL